MIFRERKDHADRLDLSDDQQPVGVTGMDDVSRIHQSQAYAASDGSRNMTVYEIELGAVNLPLIGFHGPLVLRDQGLLGRHLLFWNRVLRQQRLVTGEIDPGIVKRCLVLDQLSFSLRQHHFIRPRVNLHQRVALVNDITLPVMDLHQLPVDPTSHVTV